MVRFFTATRSVSRWARAEVFDEADQRPLDWRATRLVGSETEDDHEDHDEVKHGSCG